MFEQWVQSSSKQRTRELENSPEHNHYDVHLVCIVFSAVLQFIYQYDDSW